jgi:hypothetical protein
MYAKHSTGTSFHSLEYTSAQEVEGICQRRQSKFQLDVQDSEALNVVIPLYQAGIEDQPRPFVGKFNPEASARWLAMPENRQPIL